jgi:hypothetical protein
MMSQPLSRRELLKLLAAATGATVLSSVPNKWITPIVEIGALPAHAQGSATGTVSGFIYEDCSSDKPSHVTLAPKNGVCSPPATGSPIVGAKIQVMGSPGINSTTGSDGHFMLSNVPAGNPCFQLTLPAAPAMKSPSVSLCINLPAGGSICVNILVCVNPV